MRIVNALDIPQYIPYAGRGRRGVQLNPGEAGPEVPVSRLYERCGLRIPKDAERGSIKLIVNKQEREALKDVLPAKSLVSEGKKAKKEEPEQEAPAADTGDNAPAADEKPKAEITVEDTTDDTPETPEEPKAEPVDAIAQSLIDELALLKPRSRAGKLTHLKKSEDEGVKAALPKVIAHFEALKAQKEDPETDVYDGMNSAELMSAAVKAGLDVNPGDDDDKLRKALREAK